MNEMWILGRAFKAWKIFLPKLFFHLVYFKFPDGTVSCVAGQAGQVWPRVTMGQLSNLDKKSCHFIYPLSDNGKAHRLHCLNSFKI